MKKLYRIKRLDEYGPSELGSNGLPYIWSSDMKKHCGQVVELDEKKFETDSHYISYSGFSFYKTDFVPLEHKNSYPFPLYSIVEYRQKEYKVISSKFSSHTSNVVILHVPSVDPNEIGWRIGSVDFETYGIHTTYNGERCVYAEQQNLKLKNPFNHDKIHEQIEKIKSSPENIISNRSILLQPIPIKKRILI